MGKKGMYGLEWADENTLVGELSDDEFQKRAWEACRKDKELFPDQDAILEIPVFVLLCGYRSMDFRLKLVRSVCSGGFLDLFKQRIVRIVPGPKSEPIVAKIRFMLGRGDFGPSLLSHMDSRITPDVSMRERVEAMIALAEKDIRWCEENGEMLLNGYNKEVFGKVGKIVTVNGRGRKK